MKILTRKRNFVVELLLVWFLLIVLILGRCENQPKYLMLLVIYGSC